MKSAEVSMHGVPAGILEELEAGKKYRFTYFEKYKSLHFHCAVKRTS